MKIALEFRLTLKLISIHCNFIRILENRCINVLLKCDSRDRTCWQPPVVWETPPTPSCPTWARKMPWIARCRTSSWVWPRPWPTQRPPWSSSRRASRPTAPTRPLRTASSPPPPSAPWPRPNSSPALRSFYHNNRPSNPPQIPQNRNRIRRNLQKSAKNAIESERILQNRKRIRRNPFEIIENPQKSAKNPSKSQ